MANPNVCFDLSNHSVSTPIRDAKPAVLVDPAVMPFSPNAVDEFPETNPASTETNTTIIATNTVGKRKNLITDHLDPKTLPCCPHTDVDTEYDADIDADSALSVLSETGSSSTTANNDNENNNSIKNNRVLGVRFSPMVRVKDTLSRHEMTEKERFDYWLHNDDFLAIRRRNQRTIQAAQQAQQPQPQQNHQSEETSCPLQDDFGDDDIDDDDIDDDDIDDDDTDDDFTMRGLESCLPNENLRKRSYRFAALEEVFMEQEDQYFAGIYDDEAIARASMEVTLECRFRAECRAIQDRKEIEDYTTTMISDNNKQSTTTTTIVGGKK